MLLVANEFFDALPVRQFEMTPHGWSERMVGLAEDRESFAFALTPGPSPFASLLPAELHQAALPVGTIAELCSAAATIAADIAARLAHDRGWALIVDYGRDSSTAAATLQAVRRHHGSGVLERPGETDLSAHVDFSVLVREARTAGARVFGPTGQGDFLRRLGIEHRAAILKQRASEQQAADIDAALARLLAAEQMGTLFRVLAVGDDRSAAPAGFADGT
jgi:NADH dehydrogenase [ubiquinone] 1 alpha subcomplex assembly factor 7